MTGKTAVSSAGAHIANWLAAQHPETEHAHNPGVDNHLMLLATHKTMLEKVVFNEEVDG